MDDFSVEVLLDEIPEAHLCLVVVYVLLEGPIATQDPAYSHLQSVPFAAVQPFLGGAHLVLHVFAESVPKVLHQDVLLAEDCWGVIGRFAANR